MRSCSEFGSLVGPKVSGVSLFVYAVCLEQLYHLPLERLPCAFSQKHPKCFLHNRKPKPQTLKPDIMKSKLKIAKTRTCACLSCHFRLEPRSSQHERDFSDLWYW